MQSTTQLLTRPSRLLEAMESRKRPPSPAPPPVVPERCKASWLLTGGSRARACPAHCKVPRGFSRVKERPGALQSCARLSAGRRRCGPELCRATQGFPQGEAGPGLCQLLLGPVGSGELQSGTDFSQVGGAPSPLPTGQGAAPHSQPSVMGAVGGGASMHKLGHKEFSVVVACPISSPLPNDGALSLLWVWTFSRVPSAVAFHSPALRVPLPLPMVHGSLAS